MKLESGAQVNSSTQSSTFGSTSLIVFFSRSNNINRNLSDSNPARVCDRNASHFPSGEYSGSSSLPGLVDTFIAFAPGSSNFKVKTSLFVDAAGTGSRFVTYAISFESGAHA